MRGTTFEHFAKLDEKIFQSTSPVRGTTGRLQIRQYTDKFQSTSPVRGTTAEYLALKNGVIISIHVPREGDDEHDEFYCLDCIISIHVPREGDDLSALE